MACLASLLKILFSVSAFKYSLAWFPSSFKFLRRFYLCGALFPTGYLVGRKGLDLRRAWIRIQPGANPMYGVLQAPGIFAYSAMP
jgi:hypothetical protein